MNELMQVILKIASIACIAMIVYKTGFKHGEIQGMDHAPTPEVWLEAKKYELDRMHELVQEEVRRKR